MTEYAAFLREKIRLARVDGFDVPLEEINPALKPHTATMVDCVQSSPSAWFNGPHAFVLRDARPLPFHACNGQLGFFDVPGVAL